MATRPMVSPKKGPVKCQLQSLYLDYESLTISCGLVNGFSGEAKRNVHTGNVEVLDDSTWQEN